MLHSVPRHSVRAVSLYRSKFSDCPAGVVPNSYPKFDVLWDNVIAGAWGWPRSTVLAQVPARRFPMRRVGMLTESASRRFPATNSLRWIVVSLINGVKSWRRSASDLRRSREGNFVPACLINDPEHWRKRADEARSLAYDMKDEISKQMMLQIVDDYEHLAKRAEQRAKL